MSTNAYIDRSGNILHMCKTRCVCVCVCFVVCLVLYMGGGLVCGGLVGVGLCLWVLPRLASITAIETQGLVHFMYTRGAALYILSEGVAKILLI